MISNFSTPSLTKLLQLIKGKFDDLSPVATSGRYDDLSGVPTFATEEYVEDVVLSKIFVNNATVE